MPQRALNPRQEKIRLAVMVLLCLWLAYSAISALVTGASGLLFLISYFQVVRSVNAIIYWLHLLLFGFGVLGILIYLTIMQYKKVKTLNGAKK